MKTVDSYVGPRPELGRTASPSSEWTIRPIFRVMTEKGGGTTSQGAGLKREVRPTYSSKDIQVTF